MYNTLYCCFSSISNLLSSCLSDAQNSELKYSLSSTEIFRVVKHPKKLVISVELRSQATIGKSNGCCCNKIQIVGWLNINSHYPTKIIVPQLGKKKIVLQTYDFIPKRKQLGSTKIILHSPAIFEKLSKNEYFDQENFQSFHRAEFASVHKK